jgi:hypothetical protein
LLEGCLVAAACAFFAVTVVFAGFFIAFAMGSIPTGLLSLRRVNCACWSRFHLSMAQHSPALQFRFHPLPGRPWKAGQKHVRP